MICGGTADSMNESYELGKSPDKPTEKGRQLAVDDSLPVSTPASTADTALAEKAMRHLPPEERRVRVLSGRFTMF